MKNSTPLKHFFIRGSIPKIAQEIKTGKKNYSSLRKWGKNMNPDENIYPWLNYKEAKMFHL